MSDATATTGLAWVGDIEQQTTANQDFRRVLFTGEHLQLTVMSIPAGEDIGWEMHDHLDQFLRLERGSGSLKLGRSSGEIDEEHRISDDWATVIPAGTWHDIVNDGDTELKLYSVYGPPDHPEGTVHETKDVAEEAEEAEPSSHDHHDELPED